MNQAHQCLTLYLGGKSPGASGIRAEDIKQWCKNRDKEPTPWEIVMNIVQESFKSGEMPKRLSQAIVVLIPKNESGGYRGIGLLETLWKLITTIINQRIVSHVELHDSHHGFRPKRGTGTAIIEAKLRIQLALRQNKPLYHIFLDMSKAYDTLDRGRTIQILKAYGMGERILRILNSFWADHWIVPKQAEFFGDPFQATRSVTQGDVISPTIFNMVIDAVLHAWERDMGTIGETTIFYADDGYFASCDAETLQTAVDRFAELVAKVGLTVNPTKTKSMITKGSPVYLNILREAYKRQMNGQGEDYITRKKRLVECNQCKKMMLLSSLKDHVHFQHKGRFEQEREDEGETEEEEEGELHYHISISDGGSTRCPVPGCPATIKGAFGMRRHFLYQHVEKEVTIEGEEETTRCDLCQMFVLRTGIQKHINSKLCRVGQEREIKRQHQEAQNNTEIQFTLGGSKIEMVPYFKYLGQWLSDDDDNLIAVQEKIKKARARWARVARVLSREGANMKTMGYFYKAIVQAVLLYGSKTWVLSQRMRGMLNSFHNRCARYITRDFITHTPEQGWTFPNMERVLRKASLFDVATYIARRRETLMKYVVDRPIFARCLASQPSVTYINQLVWWIGS